MKNSNFYVYEYYYIDSAWDKISRNVCSCYAIEIMTFAQDKILEMHNISSILNHKSSDFDLPEMYFVDLERERNEHEDINLIICNMYEEAAIVLQNTKPNVLKEMLKKGASSDSVLLKRLAMRTIRNTSVFAPEEVNKIILKNGLYKMHYGRKQVFLLVKQYFPRLSIKDKDYFLNAIEQMVEEETDREFEVFNWYVWLQKVDGHNERINNYIKSVSEEKASCPLEHPENDLDFHSWRLDLNRSPFSNKDLYNMNYSAITESLIHYVGDKFDGPNRYALLKTFSDCISEDFNWAKGYVEYLIKNDIQEMDVLNYLFMGIDDSNYSLEEAIELLEMLSNYKIPSISINKANLLWKIVRLDEFKSSFEEYESKVLSLSTILFENRERDQQEFPRILDASLNTTIGIIIQSWIYMASYREELSLPREYQELFERVLRLERYEFEISLCILNTQLQFFYYKNKDWTQKNLVDFLCSNDENVFKSAWEGFLFFSGRINKDFAKYISQKFYAAIDYISWFDEESRNLFISQIMNLMINHISKPTTRYIPKLYENFTEEDRNAFLRIVGNRLRKMDDENIKIWWKKWLKTYLKNRVDNKPVSISDTESSYLPKLLLRLNVVYEEATNIICKGPAPEKMDSLYFHELYEKHFAKEFPHSTLKLLKHTLKNAKPGYYSLDYDYIVKISEELVELDEKEKKEIGEILLKIR